MTLPIKSLIAASSLALLSGLSMAADAPAPAAPPMGQNVQTPATAPAKKVVKKHATRKHAAKKHHVVKKTG